MPIVVRFAWLTFIMVLAAVTLGCYNNDPLPSVIINTDNKSTLFEIECGARLKVSGYWGEVGDTVMLRPAMFNHRGVWSSGLMAAIREHDKAKRQEAPAQPMPEEYINYRHLAWHADQDEKLTRIITYIEAQGDD